MLFSCCSYCRWNEYLGKFISGAAGFKGRLCGVQTHIVLSFSWNLSFVDIDSTSNFTHCDPQLWLLFNFMIPAGCLVILRGSWSGGGIKYSPYSLFYCSLSLYLVFNSCCHGRKPILDLKAHLTTTCNDVVFYLEARRDNYEHGSISYVYDSPWRSKIAAATYLCLGCSR